LYLFEILLPLSDNDGNRFDVSVFDRTREELIEAFGGITAFFRSPAAGAWAAPDGTVQRESIVVLEVMSEDLDRGWWHDYRRLLERRFAQDAIVVRAHGIELL
jgi:hypothetical protein